MDNPSGSSEPTAELGHPSRTSEFREKSAEIPGSVQAGEGVAVWVASPPVWGETPRQGNELIPPERAWSVLGSPPPSCAQARGKWSGSSGRRPFQCHRTINRPRETQNRMDLSATNTNVMKKESNEPTKRRPKAHHQSRPCPPHTPQGRAATPLGTR